MRYRLSLPVIFLLLALFPSCKKFVEVPLPDNQLTAEFVFANDNTAMETITGIYSTMMNSSQQFCSGYTTLFAGMSADELYYYSNSSRDEFVSNQITRVNHPNLEANFWNPAYQYIYAANECIEGAQASTQMSAAARNAVTGEAKFIRAFCYFYLVNLFGDVPLVLSTDYSFTQSLARSPLQTVYEQVINDLKDAQALLAEEYPMPGRTRPNRLSATALLARVYLYAQDWANSQNQADALINSGIYSLNPDLGNVFEANSNETIWQLQPVNPYRNTWEGNNIIPYPGSAPGYLLTNSLINSFEAGDQRLSAWTATTSFSGQDLLYPYKYKAKSGPPLTEYYVMLRLAETYLIRAEARLMQNDLTGAVEDLNILRQRAGLANSLAITSSEIALAIEQERRVELFAEWGHRWFDLKRTGRANAVLGALKPSTWQETDQLWPVPEGQIKLNSSLTQNPGY